MHIPKKYFHDRFVLLLLSTNVFAACLCVALVLLRASIGQGVDGYIVQYRDTPGLNDFEKGGIVPILSFAVFAIIVAATNSILSIRTYTLRRALSLTILGLGTLLLVLAIIVSNALLTLY